MPFEEKTIESLISASRLTEALARFNSFLDRCDEIRDNLINFNERATYLEQQSTLGTSNPREDEIERNKITWSFTKETSIFRRELSNYFKVGDNANFFDKIKNRDDIILKALEARMADREYDVGNQLNDGNSSLIFELKKGNTEQDAIALVLKVPSLMEETKQEFIKIRELRHRNIIKLIDHELNSFPFFVITEFVHGGSLTKAIGRIGARPLAQTIDWLYQLADALDYMRHRGILHTNVRPSKVFVDEELNIMLSPFDFTIANKEDRTFSRFKDVCLYGSPELVLTDGEPLSLSDMCISDQYSLGLIAYYILTGTNLFEGNSIQEILTNRHRFSVDKAYRAEKLAIFPHGVLGHIFHKLLHEDPTKRYTNLHEVVVALHAYTHNTKETHSINSVRNSYRRSLAKNRMLIADFYNTLFKKLPAIKADFQNPKRQLAMLQMGVDLLIDIDEKRSLLNALITNDKHKSYTFDKFEVFIDTLVETIKANDSQWASVESAWQVLRDKTITAIQEARKSAE